MDNKYNTEYSNFVPLPNNIHPYLYLSTCGKVSLESSSEFFLDYRPHIDHCSFVATSQQYLIFILLSV